MISHSNNYSLIAILRPAQSLELLEKPYMMIDINKRKIKFELAKKTPKNGYPHTLCL